MAKKNLWCLVSLWWLLNVVSGLQVDCFIDRESKVSCRCFGFDRDTVGQEDLSDIVERFVSEYFVNTYIRHIEMLDCGNLDLNLNLRAFVVDGIAQNISIVSFENVDDLKLNIQNVDFGDKQFVFKSVRMLALSGELMHPSTRVSIFVLNDRFYKGEVLFDDFVSESDIQLINIQDARSLRVRNSAFAQVREVDILRTDMCYAGSDVVDCDNKSQLFPSSWFSAWLLRNPAYIVLIVLVILLIILGVLACIYGRHWKRKKELELLGYPASTISRSTPPPPLQIPAGIPVQQHQQQQYPTGTTSRLGAIRPNLESDPNNGHVLPPLTDKEREMMMLDPTNLISRQPQRHTKERY